MASTMDKLAKELKAEMTASDERKPKPYDTQAEVIRVEDGTAWVHIPGGVDETPVRLTINARKGDTVNVHVANGTAWITGNSTNPPTDDRTANNAIDISTQAQKDVVILNTVVAENIEATNARFTNVEADTAKIHDLTADNLHATVGYIEDLTADSITANDISAASGYIKDLEADNITAQDISASSGYIKDLTAGNVTAQNVIADHATVGSLDANYAKVNAANIDSAAIRNAWVDKIMVQTGLLAYSSQIYTLDAIEVNAANITAGTLDVNRLIVTVGEGSSAQKYLVNIDPSTGTPSYEKLDGNIVEPRTITANKIVANSITTDEITVNNLVGTSGWINLHEGKFFYGNGADFATATNAISWNGSKLQIKADEFLLSTGKTIQDSIESVENWFYSVPPTTSNPPANSWTTTNLKEQHLRDIYFDTTSGKSYRWAKEGSTYKWVEIEDVELAALANDLHNNYPPRSEFTVAPGQIQAVVTNEANARKAIYGTCNTTAGTAAKVVTCANFARYTGAVVTVKFANANTATTPTLNINSTGAATIKSYKGDALAEAEYKWAAGSTLSFVFDGTYWRLQDSGSTAQIKVNADNINLRVQKNDVINQINVSTEGAQIKAAKVDIAGAAVFNNYSTTAEMNDAIGGAVDGIEVGGRNLCLASNKEVTKDLSTSGTVTTFGYLSDYGKTNLTVGTNVVLSFDAKASTAGLKVGGRYIRNSSGDPVTTVPEVNVVTLTTGWVRYTSEFSISATGADRLGFFTGGNTATSGTVYIRNAKVEIGNKATDWTPASEDVTAYTDNAVNSIEIGGRNLAVKAAGEDWYTVNIVDGTNKSINLFGVTDEYCIDIPSIAGVKVGDLIQVSFDIKFGSNWAATGTGTKNSYVQGTYNRAGSWKAVNYGSGGGNQKDNLESIMASSSKEGHIHTWFVVTSDMLDGTYTGLTNSNIRFDYYSGDVSVRHVMVEKATKPSNWTPAPEDVQAEIDAKKSVHTLMTANSAGANYTAILSLSVDGFSGNWGVVSTSGVKVGDTVRIGYPVSDMSMTVVYVVGTVTAVNSSTSLTMTSHGLDTTVINGGNILTNSIGANQIKVNEIEIGAAQITSGTINTARIPNLSADKITSGTINIGRIPADALNSNIEVGGRNMLVGTGTSISKATTATSSHVTQILYDTPNLAMLSALGFAVDDEVTLSFDWKVTSASTYGNARIEWYGKTSSSENSYIAPLINPFATFSASNTSGHVTKTVKLTSATVQAKRLVLRIDNSNLTLTISNLKLEKGNKATDWSPAPEDVTAYTDDAVSGIEVGGRNMLLDTDAPSLTKVYASSNRYWSSTNTTGYTGTFEETSGLPAYGAKYAVRLTQTANFNTVHMLCWYSAQVPCPTLVRGNQYTMSVWCKRVSGTDVKIRFQYGVTSYTSSNVSLENDSKWHRYSWTFTAESADGYYYANTSQTRIYIGGLYASAASEALFCGYKLEVGNKATDWTPAHEEMAATATNYISADSSGIRIASASPSTQSQRLQLTSSEAALYSSDDKKRVSITANTGVVVGRSDAGHTTINDSGLRVFVDNTDNDVASFGSSARIGPTSKPHVDINSTSISMSDGSRNVYSVSTSSGKVKVVCPYDLKFYYDPYGDAYEDKINIGRTVSSWTKITLVYKVGSTANTKTYTTFPINDTDGKYYFDATISGSTITIYIGRGTGASTSEVITITSVTFEFNTSQQVAESTIGAFADTTYSGAFRVGNGTSASAKSNAMLLDWSGNLRLKGDIFLDCDQYSNGGLSLTQRRISTCVYTSTYVEVDMFQVGMLVMLDVYIDKDTSTAAGANYVSASLANKHIPAPMGATATGIAFNSNVPIALNIWMSDNWTITCRNVGSAALSSTHCVGTITYIWSGKYTDDPI